MRPPRHAARIEGTRHRIVRLVRQFPRSVPQLGEIRILGRLFHLNRGVVHDPDLSKRPWEDGPWRPQIESSVYGHRHYRHACHESETEGSGLERHQLASRRASAFRKDHQCAPRGQMTPCLAHRGLVVTLQSHGKRATGTDETRQQRDPENRVPRHVVDPPVDADRRPDRVQICHVVRCQNDRPRERNVLHALAFDPIARARPRVRGRSQDPDEPV